MIAPLTARSSLPCLPPVVCQLQPSSSVSPSSAGRPNDKQTALAALKAVEPCVEVVGFSPTFSPRHQQRYDISLSDGRKLELSMAPSPTTRLLRSEQAMIDSEATVVRWIHGVLVHRTLYRQFETPGENDPSLVIPQPHGSADDDKKIPETETVLRDLLPTIIHRCPPPTGYDSPYPINIFQRCSSQAFSFLPSSLTDKECGDIVFQAGRLTRRFSDLKSPSGRFGPAATVLATTPSSRSHNGREDHLPKGSRTWTAAFHSLLEGILRDGEDMAITIAYSSIRKHFSRLSHFLDLVLEPRLVIVDGTEHSNILVDGAYGNGSAAGAEKGREASVRVGMRQKTNESSRFPPTSGLEMGINESIGDQRGGKAEKVAQEKGHKNKEKTPDEVRNQNQKRFIVTGLRDWSNCVFGDPLFARGFSDQPSGDFARGFLGGLESVPRRSSNVDGDGADPIEDRQNSATRLLLYQAYHATVAIVREFYGSRTDRGKTELAARMKLTEVLSQLEEVDDVPKRRNRRLSGAMSPAKRFRQDPGDDSCSAKTGHRSGA